MISNILIIAFIYLVFGYADTLELVHALKDVTQMRREKKTAGRRHVQIA